MDSEPGRAIGSDIDFATALGRFDAGRFFMAFVLNPHPRPDTNGVGQGGILTLE